MGQREKMNSALTSLFYYQSYQSVHILSQYNVSDHIMLPILTNK